MSDWAEWCRRHKKLRELKDELNLGSLSRAFKISDEVYSAVMDKDINRLEAIRDYCSTGLNEDNYYNVMHTLLQVEEAHEAISMRKFDMFSQKLFFKGATMKKHRRETTHSCFGVKVQGLTLRSDDIVVLHDPETDTYKQGKIFKVDHGDVLVPIADTERTFLEKPLNISFISRGFDSLEQTLKQALENSVIKRRIFESPEESQFDGSKINWSLQNLDKDLNIHQQEAVKGILAAKCRPKPYILFGPPGTGKTWTLACAIIYILHFCCKDIRSMSFRILFCANSNECVDSMTEKLKAFMHKNPRLIQRLNAGENVRDHWDRLQSNPIHLTTNMKSVSLRDKFNYDYVFIDEAGLATEVECLIPMSLLKDDGCLVLAGDPKQGNPVVKCEQLSEIGLGKSLLERMFEFGVYKKRPETGTYDDKFITKLLLCYRSAPSVMAISNRLFYENELDCVNRTPNFLSNMMNGGNLLQFFNVDGRESRPNNSTSWGNVEEADCCVELIRELCKLIKPEQIGVITPYKSQTGLIEEKLKESNLSDCNRIKIATVDAFQGKERQAIIISTVRSSPESVPSFIDDSGRFNVALSRAEWLVFVVGHKDVLMRCDNWREFIVKAEENQFSEQRPLIRSLTSIFRRTHDVEDDEDFVDAFIEDLCDEEDRQAERMERQRAGLPDVEVGSTFDMSTFMETLHEHMGPQMTNLAQAAYDKLTSRNPD